MPYGLPSAAIDKLTAVFRRNPRIEHVWLYGSRAVGKERMGSDIDLCIEAPRLNFADLVRLESEIDDLLLPWKIDLSLLHQIDNPTLLAQIRRVGIDLLEASSLRAASNCHDARNGPLLSSQAEPGLPHPAAKDS